MCIAGRPCGVISHWATTKLLDLPDSLWLCFSRCALTSGFCTTICRTRLAQAARRGLGNVEILTRDVVQLELPEETYDRVVSIEMFEHMRNYRHLLGNVAGWLKPGGKLFVHIFVHRTLLYPFETEGDDNWMGRHFFTGGLMPATDTLLWFQQHLRIEQRWLVDGTHYQRTANDWLRNQDANREQVMRVLEQAYGPVTARLWYQRWRMFWMACAELFGYARGQEWLVAHYRFVRPA